MDIIVFYIIDIYIIYVYLFILLYFNIDFIFNF